LIWLTWASNDYDASKLATGGPIGTPTVVVTMNYRLGLFGFFAYPARAQLNWTCADHSFRSAPVRLESIYADFNNRNGHCLSLSCDGTKAELKRLGLVLREGLRLRVSDDNLAAVGTVRWDRGVQQWVIDLDLATLQELR
jgi:hypothetical protein